MTGSPIIPWLACSVIVVSGALVCWWLDGTGRHKAPAAVAVCPRCAGATSTTRTYPCPACAVSP